MRIALDTNFLAYAEGIDDLARRNIAVAVLKQLEESSTFIPVQVLAELFRVLRKARYTDEQAQTMVSRWQNTFHPIETSTSVLQSALDLSVRHKFSIWHAVILSAAAEASCHLLLSEDLQDGFTWRGVTIVNPFAAKRHALLEEALRPKQ